MALPVNSQSPNIENFKWLLNKHAHKLDLKVVRHKDILSKSSGTTQKWYKTELKHLKNGIRELHTTRP